METNNRDNQLAEFEKLANSIKDSKLLPQHLRGNPADLVLIMLTGAELGLSPMQSLRSFYPVETSRGMALSLTADAMLAVMYANGIQFPVLSFTPTEARIEAVRPDGQRYATVFTMEDAQRAGLVDRSPMYKRYPDRMLRSRAIARVFRDLAPHLCGSNLWTPEELEDEAVSHPAHEPQKRQASGGTGEFTVAVREEPQAPPQQSTAPTPEPEPQNGSAEEKLVQPDQVVPAAQPATPWHEITLPEGYMKQLLSELKTKALRERVPDPMGQGRLMAAILRHCGLSPREEPEKLIPYVKRLAILAEIDPEMVRTAMVDAIAARVRDLVDPVHKFVTDNRLHQRLYTLLYVAMSLSDTPPVTMIRVLDRNREEFNQWIKSLELAATPHELWEKVEWLASFIRERIETT